GGGGAKPAMPAMPATSGAAPAPAPAARPEPELAVADDAADCEIVAVHLYNANVDAGANPPPSAKTIFLRHCLLDGWSREARKCWASMHDNAEATKCGAKWTDEQFERMKADFAAKGTVPVRSVTKPPSDDPM